MKKVKVFLLVLIVFLGACDVNLGEIGIPKNEATYRIKILEEKYDIGKELVKYSRGVNVDQSTGELCIDTTISYNEGSKISFSKLSYDALTVQRQAPFYLSGIANKDFLFRIKEINATNFRDLDKGAAPVSFSSFYLNNVEKSTLDPYNPYTIFGEINIRSAILKAVVTNNLGFEIDSVKIELCDIEGNMIKTFDVGAVAKGGVGTKLLSVVSSEKIVYPQNILIKVEGFVPGKNKVDLNKNNFLSVEISFETIPSTTYQIIAKDYVGMQKADTVYTGWMDKKVIVDRNGNRSADFDIYNATTTFNVENKLVANFETFSEDLVEVELALPDIHSSKYVLDTLRKVFSINGISAQETSRQDSRSLSLVQKYLGESYSPGADLVDTIRVDVMVVFPDSRGFVRASSQKVLIDLSLEELELDEIECKVNEDVIYGEKSGEIPVDLDRFKITDQAGNELAKLKMLGSPSVSFEMAPVVRSIKNPVPNMISFEVEMNSSRGSNTRAFSDNLLLGVTRSLLYPYKSNLPNQAQFLNLIEILPEKIEYSINPTIKASDSVIVVEANKDMDVKLHISSPISFDTEGEAVIFELRDDYGSGLEGMRREFHSAQIKENIYDNYIDGDFILNYKNTSNMFLGAKIIISTDKSVLYDENILTNATIETVGKDGYPNYIARIIDMGNLLPNTTSGVAMANLPQSSLDPFLMDSCFVGVKIPIRSSSASFVGDLDLTGKIEFKYNNLGDL